jgi:hypothetical protein
MATKARYDNSWVRRSQSEPRMRLERAFPPPFLRAQGRLLFHVGGTVELLGMVFLRLHSRDLPSTERRFRPTIYPRQR